jgi:DNA-binding response OmpR family regulator
MTKGKTPRKVLVVDDDPLVLRILKDRLAEEGFLVSTTSSAFGATQLVEEQVPDVVIIDVMLPALPGNRIAALVRDRMGSKGVKILLYSGKDASELEELAKESGADAWLRKSDDYDLLVEKVKSLAGKK